MVEKKKKSDKSGRENVHNLKLRDEDEEAGPT